MWAAVVPTLPKHEFLVQLEREKKRAERSKSPLSIAMFHCKGSARVSVPNIGRLLQILAWTKRDVDVVGNIDLNTVAVMLLDTDKQGTQHFLNRVASRSNGAGYTITSGTYPDDIFNTLASEAPSFSGLPRDWTEGHDKDRKVQRGLKRMIDVLGAFVALILFSPVMLMTAVAVRCTSPGPVIFSQVRVGKGGTLFTIYKFRSMFCDADDRIHRDYVASLIRKDKNGERPNGHTAFKSSWIQLKSDPRVTPVGKFIRRTKLDELPQLFNVIRGDLSLVGPRPPLVYEVENYEAWHFRRILEAKPGVTGIWQIEGGEDTTFDDMVRMDLRYIRTWSVLLDLVILIKTATNVFGLAGGVHLPRKASDGEIRKPVRTEA